MPAKQNTNPTAAVHGEAGQQDVYSVEEEYGMEQLDWQDLLPISDFRWSLVPQQFTQLTHNAQAGMSEAYKLDMLRRMRLSWPDMASLLLGHISGQKQQGRHIWPGQAQAW